MFETSGRVPSDGLKAVCIEFSSVDKGFGPIHVPRDINVAVPAGEKVVVCDPSGSGKSTMIRCINRLEKHQKGRIVVDVIEPAENKRAIDRVRQDVGMVFQSFNLHSHPTVFQNCTSAPRWVKSISRVEAGALAFRYLERARVPDKARFYPSQLSGGQQRAAIARSLCMNPKIMLFDGPTSALDPEVVREVLDTMTQLANDGMTTICVTHEMGFARQVADRVILMDAGRIVETAAPEEFFGAPKGSRTRSFLSQILH